MDQTTERDSEGTPTENITNLIVLTFAVIGVVQTGRFLVIKVRDGFRYAAAVRASGQPTTEL